MKKQTILKLIIAAICVMACMSAYAATMEDAKNWFFYKQSNSGVQNKELGVLYNAYPDKSIWYTLHNLAERNSGKYDYGCLAPNSFRFLTFTTDYWVRIEVKEDIKCGGGNICKTDSAQKRSSQNSLSSQYVRANPNGGNCYISYHNYPNNAFATDDDQKKLFQASYQQSNFGPAEPSPIQPAFTITAAFYGKEGQPTWEINGRKIVDIITRNTTNGVIWIPPNMNQYFGGDPLPNQPKIVAVQILENGELINLRQKEGKELKYPGVEGTDYWIFK